MSSEEILENIKKVVSETVPIGTVVTAVEFEGPEVVIYTRNPSMLVEETDVVKEIAKKIQKRIVIRPDASVLVEKEEATRLIREIVPPEAEITGITFDPTIYEVIIEAKKPGVVIGRNGEVMREIIKKVRWAPRVMRTPPLESSTVRGIRDTMERESEDIREILKKIGHRIYRKESTRSDWIRVTSLGGWREVGRSSMLLQTPDSKVLIDCGVNVAADTPDLAYPYLSAPEFKNAINDGELDAIILTHAHLDHSGFVPFIYKYGFDGPIYCTPPTRDLMSLLCLDYIDISQREDRPVPYGKKEIKEVIKHVIPLDYGEVRDIAPDVRLTMHNAGHILGSSIAHMNVGNGLHNVAYTGDFKYDYTRLFEPATSRFPRLETLIMESTYGSRNDRMPQRGVAEKEFMKAIKDTLDKKGKVLIPVLSVGRAQELMVVLEEYFAEGKMEKCPVFLDGMIWEATAIHTTYPEYLCKKLRDQIFHFGHNPFLSDVFEAVGTDSRRQEIKEGDPAVVLATSGMLIGGPSVEYFKTWADDEKNMLIFVSYQSEGTLGAKVQRGMTELPLRSDTGKTKTLQVKLQHRTIKGFSGHSDINQLMNFVKHIDSRLERILCVHGEESKCIELASAIYRKYKIPTTPPQNLETIRLS